MNAQRRHAQPPAQIQRKKRSPSYGSNHFVEPRGPFLAQGSADKNELIVADMNLELIEEVRRIWQFYRDRRPETYEAMVELAP
jgi:N-carbamoylputrescine amidase